MMAIQSITARSVTRWRTSKFLLCALVSGVFSNMALAHDHYKVGHGALDIFNGEGFLATPTWVQAWVVILISCFIVSVYFSWKHPLARWATGGFILSMTMGNTLFTLLGLPFLGGSIAIMHLVCWSPALLVLLMKRPYFNVDEAISFRIWSGLMVCVLIFSFVFDVRDAVIYISHVSG